MEPLLKILKNKATYSISELAALSGQSEQAVAEEMQALEASGQLLGYHAVVNPDQEDEPYVSAFIEVKVSLDRNSGFDRLASRIAQFDQVRNCYLASGGYDLLLMVEGKDLQSVARFVSEKLSTLEGVLSTATHFRLKTYKENSVMFNREGDSERLSVTP